LLGWFSLSTAAGFCQRLVNDSELAKWGARFTLEHWRQKVYRENAALIARPGASLIAALIQAWLAFFASRTSFISSRATVRTPHRIIAGIDAQTHHPHHGQ
jgi:hypothetical protein